MAQLPRGLRNNNPLNIVKGNKWLGEVQPQTDPHFEQFETLEMGLRAGFIIIRNYINRRINTPQLIISRWAPPSENDTSRYIYTVCHRANLKYNERLCFTDKNKLCRLVWAMCYMENGQEVSFGRIENAYELAKH